MSVGWRGYDKPPACAVCGILAMDLIRVERPEPQCPNASRCIEVRNQREQVSVEALASHPPPKVG